MKQGWQKRKLREVCKLINGRAYSKPELLPEGKYPVLRVGNFFTNDHWYYSDLELDEDKYCDTGDLLYAWSASFGPRMWTGGKVIFHYHIWKVRHDPLLIDQVFLFHFFLWDTEQVKEDRGAGTTMIHVSKGSMEERDILLPPLPEQHRIVAILDEAFEDIATAKANAEQNLQNVRALFESHLQQVFTERGKGWVETTLEKCCAQIFAGGDVPKDRLSQERTAEYSVPIYSNGAKNEGLYGFTDIARVTKPSITVSARGTIGFSAIRTEPFLPVVRLIVLTPDENSVDLPFLHYAVLGMDFGNTGTSIPQLTVPSLTGRKLHLPSLAQQKAIVAELDAIREETQRLESLYRQKLAALDELKKSLLHRAFSGGL